MDQRGHGGGREGGYALAALLVMVSVMAVLLSSAMPVWTTLVQREREAELIFRGEQYARAIVLYQRAFGNTPPPDLDALVDEGFLRRRYTDPMAPDGAFVPLTAAMVLAAQDGTGVATTQTLAGSTGGIGGVVGVTSSSPAMSLRVYKGARQYNQWFFLATDFTDQAGEGPAGAEEAAEAPTPARGRGGRGGPIPFPGRGAGVAP